MTLDDPQSPPHQHSPATNPNSPDSRNPNFTEIESQPEKSHLSETLTLNPQITQHPPAADGIQKQDPEQGEPDISLTSPIRSIAMDSDAVSNSVSKAAPSRRGQKRKRVNRKQLVAIQQRVQILMGNLKLVPFVPNRKLDLAAHENLLKHLGLWDFVHVELDNSDLRVDLIAQLVVNYKKHGRVSEVNGVRIRVSRADLGRALKLPPVKKDSSNVVVIMDDDAGFGDEKSVQFIVDLMSDWMLLHDEDTWILPEDVMNWIELIRKGHPDRVEWATLMWYMVEKELSQGVQLVDCYYASHLQHLIKHQNERLFLAKPDEDVNVREEEEEEDGGDVEMVDEVEEHLSTTASKDCVDNMMVFSVGNECKTVHEDHADFKMAFTQSNKHAAVYEDRISDKMAFTLTNEHAAVYEDRISDKMTFTLSNEHETVRKDHMDDKMAFTLSKELEAVRKDHVDDKMSFTLSKEDETVSNHVDNKMAFTVDKENNALSKDHVDDKMAFTVGKEINALSKDHVDGKMTFTLSNKHAAVDKDHMDEKVAFTPSNEHEAVSKDHIDENMTCILSNEHDVVNKDGIAGEKAFTLCNDLEVEKMGIDVNEVCSDSKISQEFMPVKDADANDDTHTEEFSLHIQTDKSNVNQDIQNCCPEVKSEEPSIELTLGKDNIEHNGIGEDNAQSDSVMNLDDLGLGDGDNWQLTESDTEAGPFLRTCNFGRDKDSYDAVGRIQEDVTKEEDGDDVDDEEEEEEEEEEMVEEEDMDGDDYDNDDMEEDNASAKFDSLQGISSAHLFQGVDISQGAFGSPLPHINEPHLQHFSSPAETSSTALGNTFKRTSNQEHQLSHRTMIDENKRFSSDAWNPQEPSDFYRCMGNIEQWMGKAKMMYAAKEQECNELSMHQQFLYGEMQKQSHMIEHQEKVTNELRQKSQLEIYKLERELFVMVGLLDSYKKALKETRREFSEYRERHSLLEEPLYKDAGPGGVVLSVAELERQRIKQEEEVKMKRLELERTIKNIEVEGCLVFERLHSDLLKLDEKLLLLGESVKLLKNLPKKMNAEEMSTQPFKIEETSEQPAKTDEIPEQPAKTDEVKQPAKTDEIPETEVQTVSNSSEGN